MNRQFIFDDINNQIRFNIKYLVHIPSIGFISLANNLSSVEKAMIEIERATMLNSFDYIAIPNRQNVNCVENARYLSYTDSLCILWRINEQLNRMFKVGLFKPCAHELTSIKHLIEFES